MKTRFFTFLLLLLIGTSSFAQTEIVFYDTIFHYFYNNPNDSILAGMHCMESDSSDKIINELVFEQGEGSEEGNETGAAIIPMVKVAKEYDSTGNLILELIDFRDPETSGWERFYRSERI